MTRISKASIAGFFLAIAGIAAPRPDIAVDLAKEFTIERPFLNLSVEGIRDFPSKIGMELLVDGKVVRSASATESFDKVARWRTWDVAALAGNKARLRINGGDSIQVKAVAESDTAKAIATDATILFQETLRPQFHYTSRGHWMNDPNGLVYYEGTWHLFHQYRYPESVGIAWAHATSTDLLHWTHQDVAIPSRNDNSNASGSGLVDWDNVSGLQHGPDPPILLFYTLRPPGPTSITPPSDVGKMTQNMVFSTDGGRHWQDYDSNPVLRTPDYRDRDPKVLYHKPSRGWILVLSLSQNNSHRDQARYGIFRSSDLKHWELVQTLGPGAWYWECPDLFELPLDQDPKNTRWLLVKSSGDYLVGKFDGHKFVTERGPVQMRWGGNYYATQTFADAPGGRRVQMAWMNTGKTNDSFPGMPFNQQMSFPRDLTLHSSAEGPRILRYPAKEIEQLRTNTEQRGGHALKPGDNALAGISADLLDIDLEIEPRSATQVRINLRGQEVVYDVQARKLRAFKAAAPLQLEDGRIRLRILLDRTSIEVFGNGGQSDLSGVYYAEASNRATSLEVGGGEAFIHRLAIHNLRPAVPAK